MELEIKDLPGKDKQKYRTRLTSYKAELSKLQADLVGSHYIELLMFLHLRIQGRGQGGPDPPNP